jgi:hypothetical protein
VTTLIILEDYPLNQHHRPLGSTILLGGDKKVCWYNLSPTFFSAEVIIIVCVILYHPLWNHKFASPGDKNLK